MNRTVTLWTPLLIVALGASAASARVIERVSVDSAGNLDPADDNNFTDISVALFSDGFESGDTSTCSNSVP